MISVIIVEDHELFRTGLIAILEEGNEIKVVQVYHNGKDFIESLEQKKTLQANIIFLDISMPWLSGLEVLQVIEQKGYIVPPICMLSMYPEQFYLSQLKELGARGYINKDTATDKLKVAIDLIIHGGTAFSDEIHQKKKTSSDGYLENLSTREIEVFKLLTQGMTVKEIAFELNISVKTISTYKSRLMEKLGADSLSDLLKLALMYEG